MTDEDLLSMREQKKAERRAWEEKRAPLKKKEQELKKLLGRKLTNGERNFIALSHVCANILLRQKALT